ncbi:uncharacterized protein BKCO1_25000103 [Diplodia corticola]|uniref:Uncharacterized protein n=1 Tax=Diplodia corticola TaxID=236234 RepID=A0A1J9S0I4_9PEZI|nr:uncharacterized protein BKCO1_25000103 [Diplodia corticola]OJD34087.1 hypothetical protein BKCO1_25000103 [Diplodia corticola]
MSDDGSDFSRASSEFPTIDMVFVDKKQFKKERQGLKQIVEEERTSWVKERQDLEHEAKTAAKEANGATLHAKSLHQLWTKTVRDKVRLMRENRRLREHNSHLFHTAEVLLQDQATSKGTSSIVDKARIFQTLYQYARHRMEDLELQLARAKEGKKAADEANDRQRREDKARIDELEKLLAART